MARYYRISKIEKTFEFYCPLSLFLSPSLSPPSLSPVSFYLSSSLSHSLFLKSILAKFRRRRLYFLWIKSSKLFPNTGEKYFHNNRKIFKFQVTNYQKLSSWHKTFQSKQDMLFKMGVFKRGIVWHRLVKRLKINVHEKDLENK